MSLEQAIKEVSNRSSSATAPQPDSKNKNLSYITEIKQAIGQAKDSSAYKTPSTAPQQTQPLKQLDDLSEIYLPQQQTPSEFDYDNYSLDRSATQEQPYQEETSSQPEKEERAGLMTYREAEESIQELNTSKALNDGRNMHPQKRERFNSWLLVNQIMTRVYESFSHIRAQDIEYANF